MGNLDLLFDTAQHNPLFAPVKLQRITCRKMQRDERISRNGFGPLQIAHKTLNWRIRPGVALRYELLIKLLGCPSFPPWALQILIEKFLKSKIEPVAKLVPNRRRLALVVRRARILQILLDRVAR